MAFGPNDRKGTGFTNINRVLEANQGNKLGSTVSSGVQNQATNVRTQTQTAQQKFQDEANKNRLDTEESKNKRDEIIGRFGQSGSNQTPQAQAVAGTQEVASKVQSANQPVNQQLLNRTPNYMPTGKTPTATNTAQTTAAPQSGAPAQPIVTDQEIQDFTKFRTGTYTGPNSLQDYQTLQGQAMEAQQLGDLTRSTGGRQELLRRFVGGDGYNQGQQRLDTLLLGQSGTQDLNSARRATRGLENTVADANSQAGGLAQEYTNRAKIFGEETVGKLNEARNPLSQQIDARLKQLQDEETGRQGFLKNLQGTFLDTNENTKGLDRMSRLGLGLQNAMDAGYITQTQANQLLGDGGLIQRAEQLGLDTNKLINERIQSTAAKNLNRGGAADADMEARISGLDRLLGKTGTDVEFGQAGADYEKGNLGFNLDSLQDYISKSEKEKYANDAAKMAELEAYNQRYLNQAMSNAQGAIGSGMDAAGGAMNQVLNPESYYNPGEMGQNLGNVVGGAGNAVIQGTNALAQKDNAMLEGLAKLNIGGKSLANTEGGRQLLKAIEMKSKLENEAAGLSSDYVNSVAKGTKDLLSGDLKGIAGATGLQGGYSAAKKVASNVGKEASKALKKITKPKIKIKVCFAGNTPILMADGKYKKVKELSIGDQVAVGGKVVVTGEGYGDELYDYNGVKVTGSHTVLENGVWVRVEDSEKGYPIGKEEIVYPIVTENHILLTKNQVWADMHEVEDIDGKSREEIVKELNANKSRTKKVQKDAEKFFNENKKDK